MRGSKLGIAAQAIGVLALIAIAYTAFLRPNDSTQPAGIEIENGTTTQTPPQGGEHGKSPSHKPRTAATGASQAADPVARSVLSPADPLVADTPSEAQYSDAVSRILDQLARSKP